MNCQRSPVFLRVKCDAIFCDMKALNQFITILFFCTLAFCQHRPHISSQWSAIVEIISIPGDVYEGNGGYYGFVLDAIAFMVFDNDNQRSYVESALVNSINQHINIFHLFISYFRLLGKDWRIYK